MAFRYGYFDSDIIGIDDEGMPIFDRAELSDLFALLFTSLVSDGVLARPATCFQVRSAGNGLQVEVLPGFGMVKGHFAYDEEAEILSLGTAPQKYSRIDRVVLRCNYIQRMMEIIVKTGAEASKPVPPGLIRPAAGDYYELCLANIRLSAGQKVVTQSSITDTRHDSTVCGYITQLIDHLDTSVFSAQLNQFSAEFMADMNAYFTNLSSSGNNQLQEIIRVLTEFEAASEADFIAWFNGIRDVLAKVENGKLLEEVLQLYDALYKMATDSDIDKIISGEYADDDDSSIFETASNEDIDDIIGGDYANEPESEEPVEQITVESIQKIVDDAFAGNGG